MASGTAGGGGGGGTDSATSVGACSSVALGPVDLTGTGGGRGRQSGIRTPVGRLPSARGVSRYLEVAGQGQGRWMGREGKSRGRNGEGKTCGERKGKGKGKACFGTKGKGNAASGTKGTREVSGVGKKIRASGGGGDESEEDDGVTPTFGRCLVLRRLGR